MPIFKLLFKFSFIKCGQRYPFLLQALGKFSSALVMLSISNFCSFIYAYNMLVSKRNFSTTQHVILEEKYQHSKSMVLSFFRDPLKSILYCKLSVLTICLFICLFICTCFCFCFLFCFGSFFSI